MRKEKKLFFMQWISWVGIWSLLFGVTEAAYIVLWNPSTGHVPPFSVVILMGGIGSLVGILWRAIFGLLTLLFSPKPPLLSYWPMIAGGLTGVLIGTIIWLGISAYYRMIIGAVLGSLVGLVTDILQTKKGTQQP